MYFLLPNILFWFAVGQTARGQGTIVSVLYNDSIIDIRHIPERLSLAGIPTSPKSAKVAAFLSAASIETLRFAQCQIAPTSFSTLSSDELCDYLHLARHHMPALSVACGEDTGVLKLGNRQRHNIPKSRPTTTTTARPRLSTTMTPQMTTARTATTTAVQSTTPPATTTPAAQSPRPPVDDKVYSDDPLVRFQTQMSRMKMSDVMHLIKQYQRRDVTVAVIDDGVDFTDPGLAPLRSSFTMSDGRVIDGGWKFINDSSTLTFGNYHGQYISRIIGAKANNPYGMAGIARDHVRLLSLQVFEGNSTGLVGNLLKALDMAIDIGVDVISLSMGYRFNTVSFGPSRQLM